MGILGKLLLFVNLLAGAGFVYLAAQDWTKRQAVTAAGLRHSMARTGFPLDGPDALPTNPEDPNDPDVEIPFPVEAPGGTVNQTVSKKFLETYFAAVAAPGKSAAPAEGETPAPAAADPDAPKFGKAELVTSQLGEVRRVRKVAETAFAPGDAAAKKAGQVAAVLLRTAETLEERGEVYKRLAAGDLPGLNALLAAEFDRVLKKGDEAEQRFRLAHLLVHLDPDPTWQKRVALIVGVPRYAKTIAAQAARYGEMAQQVERQIDLDQAGYLAKYRELQDLAVGRTGLVVDSVARLKAIRAQVEKDKEFVEQRTTELKRQTDEFARVKGQVDQLMAEQARLEARLFDTQRAVGGTLDSIFELEAELARKEREAGRQPTPTSTGGRP